MRAKVVNLIENSYFQKFIIYLIIANGISLGLETSKEIMRQYGTVLYWFDVFALSVFTIEIILKIYAYGKNFFKDPWNLFDFTIVAISLMPTSGAFSVLRAFRILRLFRLLVVIPQMRKVVSALISVIPGMSSVIMIMILFFYVFAVICVKLFGEAFPQWFGTIGESFYTLFQIMTLESWSMGIARPIMETYPYAYLVFVPFILIMTFVVINLVVAIIVDAMNSLKDDDGKNSEKVLLEEIKNLRKEIKSLHERIDKQI